jgi:hypothetical protein
MTKWATYNSRLPLNFNQLHFASGIQSIMFPTIHMYPVVDPRLNIPEVRGTWGK